MNESKEIKYRVLLIEFSSGFGGSAVALVSLVRFLNKNKFSVIIAFKNKGSQLEKINDAEFIKFEDYKEAVGSSGFVFLLNFLRYGLPESIRLIRIIKRRKIRLVHINNNIIAGIPAILAAKMSGVPCVCHIRQTRALIRREIAFLPLIDKVIVLTKDAWNLYKKWVPENKLVIVHDGIDPEEYSKISGGSFCSEFNLGLNFLVGLIGRIVKGKGQKEFVLMAQRINQKYEDIKIKFILVGDAKGEEVSYFDEVKELIEENKLEKSVLLTGWRSDIGNIIADLDVVVQGTTTFPEGFGLTIVEAMALRKPVIASNIPGPASIVVNGETGFLVAPGNIDEMTDKCMYLFNNREISKKMGEAGRKRVEELFDISKNVKQIEAIYDEILK